ncbi:MAG: prepilin-type N-terminal cleavage/methylation domain-containing protein [Planctomycetaceae bacterium]
MNRRHAFTLVELLLALAASSVLMGLAVGLVHRSMSANSLAKSRADHQQALVRLCDQFRMDIHQGSRSELPDSARLRLHLPEGTAIEYTINGSRCRREESLDTGRKRVETYSLHEHSQLAFAQLTDPDRVTLVVKRQSTTAREPAPVDAHVVAVVGRRLSWQSQLETNP